MKYNGTAEEGRECRTHDISGFTLVELLVVISIIAILVAMLLPAVQATREASRRTSCGNNLHQLAIAAHSYHSSFGAFPMSRTNSTSDQWSHFTKMLPYLEFKTIYDEIDFSKQITDSVNLGIAALSVPMFHCPSDVNMLVDVNNANDWANYQKNNYRGNSGSLPGDVTTTNGSISENSNGVFCMGRTVSATNIQDGTSHTVLFAEAIMGDGDNSKVSVPGDFFATASTNTTVDLLLAALTASDTSVQFSYAGRSYLPGQFITTTYNHIGVPNSASVIAVNGATASSGDAISMSSDSGENLANLAHASSASSRHPGGVNVAMADGSVRFIANGISQSTWSALGSIADHQDISVEF